VTRIPLSEALADEARAERLSTLRGPDSPEGRELAAVLGANVARHRGARGLDLDALGARAGIDVGLLREIEAGRTVPSLRAIWHLATALGVPFGALLEHTSFSTTPNPDFRVQRAPRGRVIASASNQFRSRVLFLEGDARAPEVYELTLEPGCVERAAAHAPETFEHLVVVQGTLLVRAGEEEARLEPGDALFFRADVPHGYTNPGAEPAVAHLVMTYAMARTTPG